MSNTESISSIKKPATITVSGFDSLDSITHMIEWLGKGPLFREFMVSDVERELYAQDKLAQLLSLRIVGEPQHETKLLPLNDGTSNAALTGFLFKVPITLTVKAGDARYWRLQVGLGYVASNLNQPGRHALQLNFDVLNAECIQPEHA